MTLVTSANNVGSDTALIVRGRSFIYIYIMNSGGPRTDPWGTPCFCVHHHHHHQPVVCLTTGSKPLPKRSLHILWSTASSFKWEYPLLSLRSSSGFLRLLPCLLITSIAPFIFPSIICFRRQFLRKMWTIQLAFRFLIACRIFLCSLTWSNTSSFLTWSVQLISWTDIYIYIYIGLIPTHYIHPTESPNFNVFTCLSTINSKGRWNLNVGIFLCCILVFFSHNWRHQSNTL